MQSQGRSFKRLVVGLDVGPSDTSLHLAAELAERLRLDLLGLMVEDGNLRALAAMPFAREFRPLGGGWRPIDEQTLSHEQILARRRVERAFAEAVKRFAHRCRLEVVQGRAAELLAAISRTDDIVMISEPSNPAERATQPLSTLLDAAFRSAAAVMVVPPKIARWHGPVLAIAASPVDLAVAAAAEIAGALGEEVRIIDARSVVDSPAAHHLAAKPTLASSSECLVVMTRGAHGDTTALAIAARRGIPVLVIEPPGEAARVGEPTATGGRTRSRVP